MPFVERIHTWKKKAVALYKAYLTEEGSYTSLLPDRIYLKKLYKKRMGRELDLNNPKTFTEKLNWLKLYDRDPAYTMMVDKYAVREYVKEKVGEEYLVPLIGAWDTVEEIPFDDLPDQFVLKCNHDNGVIICRDKSQFDVEAAKKELAFHLQRNYYKKCREWPYKNVKRKIICEKFMNDGTEKPLVDYKFFCFDGRVKALFVATDRPYDTRFDFYDEQFNHLPITNGHPNSNKCITKPNGFDNMIEVAERLSNGIPHVRIDLYYIKDQVYFSEMTFHHFGGFHPLEPLSWDLQFGEWIELPNKEK